MVAIVFSKFRAIPYNKDFLLHNPLSCASRLSPLGLLFALLLFSPPAHSQYAWNRETTHALGATSKTYAHLHTYADGSDYLYLTGTAGVNGINPNVLTAKLNNNGSLGWLEIFNRANGIDAGFVIQPADTLVRVLGATHPASGTWSVTELRYEPSTGTLADTTFVSAGNVLFDDRIRFAASTNRLYVTGGTSTTSKQKSEALGFTSSLNTAYQQDVDLFADRTDVTALYLDKTTDGLLLAGEGAINNRHYTTFLQHRAANGSVTYSDTLI